jgi:hypothetical protein
MQLSVSRTPSNLAHAVLRLSFAFGVLAIASSAQAQVLGAPGTLAVGVENISGYDAITTKYEDDRNVEVTNSTTQFSFLLKTGARVGVHYFFIPHVSLGGSVGYESFSGSVTQPDGGGNYSYDKQTDSRFLLHLKAGYLLALSNSAGFWFRAGPGMNRSSTHPGVSTPHVVTETFWTVGLDVLFVYAPLPVVGFFAGPTGDLSFVGRHSEDNFGTNNNLSYSHSGSYHRLGLDLGIMAMF